MRPYSDLMKDKKYDNVLAGAVVGIKFILADDPSVWFVGSGNGISGFTISEQIEALPVESVGTRIADEIVRGRFSGTASVNGFFSYRKGNEFVPDSATFPYLQWHAYRYVVNPDDPLQDGAPIDGVTYWTIATANIPQGARGNMTFDMNGPFIERLNGERAAAFFGVM